MLTYGCEDSGVSEWISNESYMGGVAWGDRFCALFGIDVPEQSDRSLATDPRAGIRGVMMIGSDPKNNTADNFLSFYYTLEI